MQTHMTRAWVEIDLGALRRNGASVAARTGVPILPMVKADGYGLGATAVVSALEPLAPWGYGVATIAEGAELRDAGITRPILVFTPALKDQLGDLLAQRLTPVLASAEEIEGWSRLGGAAWHLAVDTGMSRTGIRWHLVSTLTDVMKKSPPAGAFTHLHSADTDPESVKLQEHRFSEALPHIPGQPLRHVENSCAIVRRRRSPWDLVRPGIVLYGAGGGPDVELVPEPVVHVRARVISMRTVEAGDTVSYGGSWRAAGERSIATLAIGYADGYPRAMGGRGTVLLNGCRAPVAGVVTMDMTMVDATGIPCRIGDVATLIGRDGGDLLAVDHVAEAGDLSPYELLTRLRSRIERVYVER